MLGVLMGLWVLLLELCFILRPWWQGELIVWGWMFSLITVGWSPFILLGLVENLCFSGKNHWGEARVSSCFKLILLVAMMGVWVQTARDSSSLLVCTLFTRQGRCGFPKVCGSSSWGYFTPVVPDAEWWFWTVDYLESDSIQPLSSLTIARRVYIPGVMAWIQFTCPPSLLMLSQSPLWGMMRKEA